MVFDRRRFHFNSGEVTSMFARSFALLVAVAVVCGVGCSKEESAPNGSTASQSPASASNQNDPAVLAAQGFLSALIKGDTQSATQHLTPQAIQQFETSGQRFVALGPETMQFRMGEMRKVSESQTLVQCMLADKTKDGAPQEQEMCCVMKLVDGQWRVSGIVVDSPNGAAPLVLNFELPEQAPQTTPPAQNFAQQPATEATKPAVRTAQEPAVPPQR
jgi:hypothetical protein